MKKILEILDDEELITCEICSELYSKDKNAFILKCGHTFCKDCLKSAIKSGKCHKCRMEINDTENNTNLYWENKPIDGLLELCHLVNINIGFLFSLPLSFKYCEQCQFFITNYSFTAHKKCNHTLKLFEEKLQLFFNTNKILDKNEIIEDRNNKFLYFFIYYYQNPFLHKIKYFELKKSFYLKDKRYKFYGQFIDSLEHYIFLNLKKIGKNDQISGRWHKGVLINRKNSLVIHGYFLFKSINDYKVELENPIFGLLSFKDIQFFGFFKLITDTKEDILDYKNIVLICGLFYDGKNYYFGKFRNQNINFLLNDENKNKLDINIKKILEKGEILIPKGEEIEIKREPIPQNIDLKTEKKPLINYIYEENSDYFIKKEINNKEEKIKIFPIKAEEQRTPIPEKSVIYFYEEKPEHPAKIEVVVNKNEKITIFPQDKKNSQLLSNSRISLDKYKVNMNFPNENDNSIIIFKTNNDIANNSHSKEGFLIEFNEQDKSLLEKIKNMKKNELDEPDNIFKNIEDLFDIKIQNCIIKNYNFKIMDDIIIDKKEKKFEFVSESPNLKYKRKKNIKQISLKDKIENTQIKDILSKLFIQNGKNEDIHCTCITI